MSVAMVLAYGTFGIGIIIFFMIWYIMKQLDRKTKMIAAMQDTLSERLKEVEADGNNNNSLNNSDSDTKV